ncbi:asparagine synthase (glutamine-hydrolyzing) [Phyllobacterium salinisoli]|uniref:asparagine synthase (glutamine-hydrolyzing) n=1 Tax=Phyllobacterium salinisoli TaxID=1899321 RepID=A0A368JZR9_9HYPH|nr:asparagine synthase (glutamine-hydrolyzing) [Phyllobacterium salinisoli]RCS22656.1 asparagine synthase (glutamine-hydrolyzing) [Phyllobacterium salinisoli]
MCGIAGIVSQDRTAAARALHRMVEAQRHRGPDGSGESIACFGSGVLALGHTRLAIIDVSSAGAQPMVHPATGDRLVFNGEIYNHGHLRHELAARGCVFRGTSDSETLLHALVEWGPQCIARLEGMFAFAFHRAATGELLLARDPLGIKPLYLAPGLTNGCDLVFASEVRAILRCDLVAREISVKGLAGLLSYGAVQHPFTLFETIRSFPAGCWQRFPADGRADDPIRFWQPARPDPARDMITTLAAVRQTVDAAVRDHLVSDVPLGLFLSSGLDSSIVAGTASRHVRDLRSFTVGFADNPDMNELALATRTAELFGLHHTECLINGGDALDAVTSWLDALDQPSIDGLNVYVISKAAREHGIKVALSGQGGDELFGGYSTFRDVPVLHRMMRPVSALPPALRRRLAEIATINRSTSTRAKASAIASCDGDLISLYMQRRRLMTPTQLRRLGLDHIAAGLTVDFHDPREIDALSIEEKDPVWTVSLLESRFYLANMLLRDGDANSMAHGFEVRVPFLDRRLLDLTASIPGHIRLPADGSPKHLLRAAFPDILRPELLSQPKSGFALPIGRWMTGPLLDICRNGLESLKGCGLLAPAGVDAIWDTFAAEPETPAWSRAFLCAVIGQYLQRVCEPADMRLAS